MIFILILIATTFSIAVAAAFFSVYGLMQTFSAIAIPILMMGVSLEMGKLVAASALYRLWDKLMVWLKYWLLGALLLLMIFTSGGIFGYLIQAYQKNTLPADQIYQTIESDQQEIDRLIQRKKAIDDQIAKLPNNYVNARQKLMATFEPELKQINPRIEELQKEITDFKTKKIDTEAHIGPIMYVAKLMGKSPDQAIFWFVMLIVLIFDPLAVALTLTTNVALKDLKEKKEKQKAIVVQEKLEQQPEQQASDSFVGPEPTSTPTDSVTLTKDDIVKIIRDNMNHEGLESLEKRSEILKELRK